MSDQDAVKRLAEAMGHTVKPSGSLWKDSGGPLNSYFLFRGPGYEVADILIWNPFKDANHDYAVLEWAIKEFDPDAYLHALTQVVGSYAYLHEYRVGYWAQAALKCLPTGHSDE